MKIFRYFRVTKVDYNLSQPLIFTYLDPSEKIYLKRPVQVKVSPHKKDTKWAIYISFIIRKKQKKQKYISSLSKPKFDLISINYRAYFKAKYNPISRYKLDYQYWYPKFSNFNRSELKYHW